MRSTFRLSLLVFLACRLLIASGQTSPTRLQAPKIIIIMISDGCGYNHILATDYYMTGKATSQAYENFPVQLGMSTFPAKLSATSPLIDSVKGYIPDSAWADFSYPVRGWTDSSPAATTLASGIKTYNGAVGVDVDFRPLINITRMAKELGKSAGVVTSVQLSHATPAGFVAHNNSRDKYDEIAREMMLDSRLEVIMGCGNPGFNDDGQKITSGHDYKYVGGKPAWDSLVAGSTRFSEPSLSGNYQLRDIDGDGIPDSWTLIQQRNEFLSLATGETPKRVLGVAEIRSTLQQSRSGKTDTLPFAIPFINTVPTLKEMALAALNVLDNNPSGFFLMVEGGAVDWAGHENQQSRLIEEEAGFNEAADAVIHWIENNGGWDSTLLIVTGDHECGYLCGPKYRDNSPETNPVVNKGKGNMPDMKFNSPDHTNMLIPFFAKGQGALLYNNYAYRSDPVRGKYLDIADVARVCFLLWPLQ